MVMSLVYDNKNLPYYEHAKDIRDHFDGIVKSIDKWSTNDLEKPDDECDGIISSVFHCKKEKFNLELIVRAVHILVMYDDDSEHSAYLQRKYESLFKFWFDRVVPEMQNYFKNNKEAIRINTIVELLSNLSKSEIKFKASKNMEQLTENKVTIVITNVPRLLLLNINKYLLMKFGGMLNSQNVFIEPEKINNDQVKKDLVHLYSENVKLNVFVDCTKGRLDCLNKILDYDNLNIILVSNEKESTKLIENCNRKEISLKIEDINYKWSDLEEESQKMLLKTKVTFQNNSKILLKELLTNNTNPDENEHKRIIEDFSNIINDHIFNLIVDKQEIFINSNVEDSKVKNFENLFQKRNFLKKGIKFKNEISQEKLISITAHNKYVLISDVAGSGKSWVVKNISKIIMKQDPTRWVTYVDLKLFVKKLKKQPKNLEFENYFIENILKLKTEETKFEVEIFKKLYRNGNVSIIFDAFDEIAPKCAEFVTDLAKSFGSNDGNQLWIITRDYFEVNLKDELKIDNVYKLSELIEEDGINFIVNYWILKDSKEQPIKDFEKHKENSPNFTQYLEKAKRIVKKVDMSKNQSIGLPQIFSMIADGFKDDTDMLDDDLKRSNIFGKFVQKMYTRWFKKGKLQEDASVKSQDYKLNYKKLHQFVAIYSSFPKYIDSFFPKCKINEWPETDIIAGGFLNKIGSSYSFTHETYREYFVAEFISKAIKEPTIEKEIVELLVKVLTIQKYGIIRMFLNDFIEKYSILKEVQLELEKSVEKFSNMEILSEYFTENLEHLAKCVIKILNNGDYEKVKKIICENIKVVASRTKELKTFSMFTEFLFSKLRLNDLKEIINSQNILHEMIRHQDLEMFEYFVQKLEAKAGCEFIQQQLKLMPSGYENGNIFYHLGTSENLSENKVKKFFEIIQKYLNGNEIFDLMDKCNQNGQSILRILFENTANFKPFLDGAECYFTSQNLFKKFKNIVKKTDLNGQNVVHWSANKQGTDFHTSLWTLIQKTFENRQEREELLSKKTKIGNNFIQLLVTFNTADVIEFTIKKLKENLNESDYHKILRSKGYLGRNLLQFAAVNSKELKTNQILWKTLRDSCKSDENFLEILREDDEHGSDVFNHAAAFTTAEIFTFLVEELTKITSEDKIKKVFIKLGIGKRNLLQAAALQNKSLELHKTLWKILPNYFSSSELLEFIRNCTADGKNLLLNVIEMYIKEIVELTWKKVKRLLKRNDLITEENKENIQRCKNIMKGISGPTNLRIDEREILELKWIKNKNTETSKLFDEEIQASVEKSLNANKSLNIELFITDRDVKHHERLWENLIYKSRTDLKKLFFEKNEYGDNFIHHLVTFNTADVIKFTLEKLKEKLTESDYQQILRSKGQNGRNLLQYAACRSTEVKTHQVLWKELRCTCDNDENFLEFLGEVDDQGSDIFNHAAAFTTGKVIEFMDKELKTIKSHNEVKILLRNLGFKSRHVLQTAAEAKNSLEVYDALWKMIKNNLNSSEILEFITHTDASRANLLIIAKTMSTKEILERTWTEVKRILTELFTDNETQQKIMQCERIIQTNAEIKVEELEFLKLEWIQYPNSESTNLFDKHIQDIVTKNKVKKFGTLIDLLPFAVDKNISNHKILWNCFLKTDENQQNLPKILREKTDNGNKFIHNHVIINIFDVIKFTLEMLEENLSDSVYQEILRSKGYIGRNLLQVAAEHVKDVRIYQILWKTLQDSCKSDEKFVEVLGELDENCDNVFNNAATFANKEIVEFMKQELEKIPLHKEVKALLINLGFYRRNLLQTAAIQNKSLELHEALWKIIENYFNSSEILQFIKHCDIDGYNVLLIAIIYNTKEIKELTWNKVRSTLITIKYEDNENIKKCDEIMKKDLKFDELTKEEKEVLKLNWIDIENSVKLFEDSIQLLMQKAVSDISLKDLMMFQADKNKKNHEKIWKYLEENVKKYEELRKLFFEKSVDGNNFLHLLVAYNTADVIKFTLNKYKEYLSESDYQQILRSKGQFGRNLLQLAVKELKQYQIVWEALRNSCKSDEFLQILGQVDESGFNVYIFALALPTGEIFEYMIDEIEKITNNKDVRKILISFEKEGTNLLRLIVINNKSLETIKTVWKIICKYFDKKEILEFIEYCYINDDNLLCCTVLYNTKEIAEFTWNQIKIYIDKKEAQVKYLNKKGKQGIILHQLSLVNQAKDSQVAEWVQKTLQEYKIQ